MGGFPSIFDDSDQEAENGVPGYKNVQFYRNEIRSKPRSGHKIDDILLWLGDYKKLENDHGYIQWLFPIPGSRGMNHYAQELHEYEAQAIRDDDTMRCRVFQAYIMMLDFYGMRLADDTSGEVIKTPYNWKERFDNLNRSPHNYRRISRIITSLGELGYERFQVPLVTFLMEMAIVRKELTNITGGCMWHWIEAIKDPQERGQMHKNYRELLKNPQTSLREIEYDTEAGSSQNFELVDLQGTPEGSESTSSANTTANQGETKTSCDAKENEINASTQNGDSSALDTSDQLNGNDKQNAVENSAQTFPKEACDRNLVPNEPDKDVQNGTNMGFSLRL